MKRSDISQFGLPVRSCAEDLEWQRQGRTTVVLFDDKIVLAGSEWAPSGSPSWFGAVYRSIDDVDIIGDEDPAELLFVSGLSFNDAGHALSWALKNARNW